MSGILWQLRVRRASAAEPERTALDVLLFQDQGFATIGGKDIAIGHFVDRIRGVPRRTVEVFQMDTAAVKGSRRVETSAVESDVWMLRDSKRLTHGMPMNRDRPHHGIGSKTICRMSTTATAAFFLGRTVTRTAPGRRRTRPNGSMTMF